MTPDTADRLQQARAAGRPIVLATRLPDGAQRLLPEDGAQRLLPDDGAQRLLPNDGAPDALADAARVVLRQDKSAVVAIEGHDWFLHAFNPPLRLVVVGAVHVAQALVPMAAPLGFGVTVIDPRRSFATAERFPGVTLSTEWPDEAMDALGPDTRTAIVTLTHDPKLDDPALDRALRSDAFYIGALGSRRTHARRLERLRELGHDEAATGRIRGPVGLDIAAVTAPEIALSILAQIVEVRRRGP